MSEKPVILSVVIPVYNAEDTIRETLDSVLGQSLKEIEVICVDDGSRDGSVDIIREYTQRDPRVSLIRQQNQYAGAARNAGIDAAKGEYLFFLDADDYVLDYALEAVCAKAVKHRLDCLKFLSLTRDGKEERYVDSRRNSGGNLRPEDYDRLVKVEKGSPLLRINVTPWSGIYRRAFVLEKNCRFNRLKCVNDRSFYSKVITNADRIMVTRDRVTVHRVNQEQSLVGKRAANFHCQIDSARITERQLREDGIPAEAAEQIMQEEFLDLAVWYKRFSGAPEQKEKMTRQITEYLDSGETAYGDILRERLAEKRRPSRPPEVVRPFHDRSANPAVSVLMPVRKGDENPDRALESLTKQAAEDMEFLLLYTGGPDLNLTLLKEYAAVDRRFEIIEMSGDGYGRMINRGLEQARGEYAGILLPDEYIPEGTYELLRSETENGRPDLVQADSGRSWSCLYRRGFLQEHGIRWAEKGGCAFRADGILQQMRENACSVRTVRGGTAAERPGGLAARLPRKIVSAGRMIREQGVGAAVRYVLGKRR